MQSYDYAQRQGVEAITWERFAELSAHLVEQLAPHHIDAVVGIARAGLFPATHVAAVLRCDLYPCALSRRVGDTVMFERPVWNVNVSPAVAGKHIAVVDEIADTGQTLAVVAERARDLGAAKIITASLARHTWANPAPEVCALVSDALIIFPWDQRVYVNGQWQPHPEIEEALRLQASRN
jgi:hypothetical protein